jgi:hypothetical protein
VNHKVESAGALRRAIVLMLLGMVAYFLSFDEYFRPGEKDKTVVPMGAEYALSAESLNEVTRTKAES